MAFNINFISLLFALVFNCSLIAQDASSNYIPFNNVADNEEQIVYRLSYKRERDLRDFNLPKGKKIWTEIIEERYRRIASALIDGHYVFDERVNDYFNNILENIYAANPEIPKKEIRLFISKSPVPNAYCVGDGTLILNMALLRRLENESQIAFVICHEMAHYIENHVNKRVKDYIKLSTNKSLKNEVNKARRSRYGYGQKLDKIYSDIVYSYMYNSREDELEADDIGFKLLANTNYDTHAAIEVLEILDNIDKEKYKEPINLKEVFSFEDYPFKDKWLASEDFIGFNDGSKERIAENDSLKTHPDCEDRIAVLADRVKVKPEKNAEKTFIDTFVMMSDYELIEGFYFFEQFDHAMYHALKMLNEYPENAYLHAMIGKCFNDIIMGMDDHSLGGSVGFATSEDTEFNDLLKFIRNMRVREMKKVNYLFLQKHVAQSLHSEDFLYAWAMANYFMGNIEDYLVVRKSYFEQYGDNGYYSADLPVD